MLCHRDYHSRNLMLHNDRLYIIDFQDARMGPTPTTLCRCCATPTSISASSRSRRSSRSSWPSGVRRPPRCGFSAPVRPDGAPAELEGPRDLRLSNDVPREYRCTSNTSRGRSPTCAPIWPGTSDSAAFAIYSPSISKNCSKHRPQASGTRAQGCSGTRREGPSGASEA